jgi:hypothetical protein
VIIGDEVQPTSVPVTTIGNLSMSVAELLLGFGSANQAGGVTVAVLTSLPLVD